MQRWCNFDRELDRPGEMQWTVRIEQVLKKNCFDLYVRQIDEIAVRSFAEVAKLMKVKTIAEYIE